MAMRILAISSADAGYFGLLRDMVRSVKQQRGLPAVEFAFSDLGLIEPQLEWLRCDSDRILTPHLDFDLPESSATPLLIAFLVRANWICDRGLPMWNDDAEAFCQPYAPYRVLSALHLAGPAKRTGYRIQRTGGGAFETMIRYGARPAAAAAAG